MKVSRVAAVAFFVALGFEKAGKWDDAKLAGRLTSLGENVEPGAVPDGQEEFYRNIVRNEGKIELDGAAEAKPAKGEGKPSKKGKKAKADPEVEEAPPEEEAPKAKSKKGKKSAKEEVVEEKPKAKKKDRKPAAEKEKVDRDGYGCRVGCISNLVNEQINGEWKTEEELAEAAGVTLDQARGRLYYGAEQGLFEREKLIRYRVAKKEKKA